jgi:hypothetical protein
MYLNLNERINSLNVQVWPDTFRDVYGRSKKEEMNVRDSIKINNAIKFYSKDKLKLKLNSKNTDFFLIQNYFVFERSKV